ncbi:SMR family transporter [Bacillus sp. Cr_A10]|nr:SMR family transporter [Bacillus sp. Cr_A10]MDF2066704.1 SMR family transporter [Bacillus sp. Cr_A10]
MILFSYFLLSKALHSIPLELVTIFTGLGTVGTVVTGVLLYYYAKVIA